MKSYRVTQDYRAVYGEEMIVLKEGDVVEMPDEAAEWVNRDSPGTLEEILPLVDDVVVQEEEAEREMTPVQDRMMRPAKTRN